MLTIVAERWDPDRGGRERYAADLVAYLHAEGRAVIRAKPDRTDAGTRHRILALSPVPRATHYQLHGGLLSSAFERERESIQSVLRRALFHPTLAWHRRRQRLLDDERRLLEGKTKLMAFCDATERELAARGVKPSEVRVSRPGVDLRRFRPPVAAAAAERASLHLTFVGHNFALKGLQAAILTIARLRRGGIDASLTVAGRGPVAAFRRIAARAGVGDHVRFAGSISQDDVAHLHRASDALIHPTFYDPFPRVVIEALASGCPVITTASCGAAEILSDGRQGFIVRDPRDVEALAEAVSRLANPERRACLRRGAAELGQSFEQSRHFQEASRWIFGDSRA
jgi:glycosyltransferase involved in cell wall biosynthesis